MRYVNSIKQLAKGKRRFQSNELSVLAAFGGDRCATLINHRLHWADHTPGECTYDECRIINAFVQADILKIDRFGIYTISELGIGLLRGHHA